MILDNLAAAGVNHIDMRAVYAGGRWHVDVQWVGNQPDRPQTLDTLISGHAEQLPSLEAAIDNIAEEAK